MKKSTKLLLTSLLLLAMLSISSGILHAQSAGDTGEDGIHVVLDGKKLTFDVPPQMMNGRTLVPLRAIFEEMGAAIEWDGALQTVTAKKGDTVVTLTIGDTSPTINGKVVPIDQPGIIIDSRTLAPLRFVAEAFGGTVEWSIPDNTAKITRHQADTAAVYVNPQLGFSVVFPAAWSGKYHMETTEFERNGGIGGAINLFHNPTIEELGNAGLLFTLGRAPGEEYTEDEPPIMSGASILLAREGGYTYFINFPSGVEYSEAVNSESAKEYKEWESQIESMLDSFQLIK